MTELINTINTGYRARIADIKEQKKIWLMLSEAFTPDIYKRPDQRPSSLIAAETGDLGLAVLWIVQASIIRPVIGDILRFAEHDDTLTSMLNKIGAGSLCALAHSEDPRNPVILSRQDCNYTLNGEKKFITAGLNADFILVTCRKTGEDKIGNIAIIGASALTEESRPDLNLEIMMSVNHTGLILKNTSVPAEMVPRMSTQSVRRTVKKWGIIERALILEAFLSFLLYAEKSLNGEGAGITRSSEILNLINDQSKSVNKQISEAVSGDRIETANIPMQEIIPLLDIFQKAYIKTESILSEADRIKLKDLFMFNSLK